MSRADLTVEEMKAKGWKFIGVRQCMSPRCDAMVEFWRNPKTGKDSPYDAIEADTPYSTLGPILRRSHFARCPDAPQFRSRKS